MKRFCLLFAVAFCVASCTTDDVLQSNSEPPTALDIALQDMCTMWNELYGGGTRAISAMNVAEIVPIYAPMGTKVIGGGGNTETEPLVYVVNLENHSGYSVLSTHPAVENVIALGNSGSLKIEYFTRAVTNCANDICDVCDTAESEEADEDYEPDDSISLNYNDSIIFQDLVKAPFAVTPANCAIPNETIDIQAQETIARLIVEYVWSIVEKYTRGWLEFDDNLGGVSGYNYWGEWVSTQGIPPMLKTKWHQRIPYNKVCYTSTGQRAVAGCVPIAVAQITAYHKRHLSGKWAIINKIGVWDMERQQWYVGNNIEQTEVGEFVKQVGVLCKAKYGVNETSSTLSKAKKGMQELGYQNVKKHQYSAATVENRLRSGCPVYIQGASSSSAHAWVIDGMMRQRRMNVANGKVQVRTLMHCNWGWQGSYDGYFSSSVFNATMGPHFNVPDLGETRSADKHNYNHRLKIITYSAPAFVE